MKREFKYTIVDFDNVTEKGLKELITTLKHNKIIVDKVSASNKKLNRDGFDVKKAKLSLDNGQTVTIFAGEKGDLYQLVLNGKKIPLPNVNTLKAFAKDLAKLIEKSQPDFDAKQAAKIAKVPNTSNDKPLTRSLQKRAAEATAHLDNLASTRQEAETALATTQAELVAATTLEQRKMAELEQEKAETSQLKEQLNELQSNQ